MNVLSSCARIIRVRGLFAAIVLPVNSLCCNRSRTKSIAPQSSGNVDSAGFKTFTAGMAAGPATTPGKTDDVLVAGSIFVHVAARLTPWWRAEQHICGSDAGNTDVERAVVFHRL